MARMVSAKLVSAKLASAKMVRAKWSNFELSVESSNELPQFSFALL